MFVDGVQTSESTRSPDVESWWEWNSRGILPMFDFTVVGDKKVVTFSVESAEIVRGKSAIYREYSINLHSKTL